MRTYVRTYYLAVFFFVCALAKSYEISPWSNILIPYIVTHDLFSLFIVCSCGTLVWRMYIHMHVFAHAYVLFTQYFIVLAYDVKMVSWFPLSY
jgi:hypothetical protein